MSRIKTRGSRRYGKQPDNDKSRYGKKKAYRTAHCGGAPLPCFPEIMLIPSHKKPWN